MTDPAVLIDALSCPVKSAEVIFGAKSWSKTEQIHRDLEEPEARVIAYGCHSSGKTHTGVIADFRHVMKHSDGRVIAMAPTSPQLGLIYWAEARTIHAQMLEPLLPPINHEFLAYPGQPKRGIVSVSTDRPERMRGLKGGHLRAHLEEINGTREEHFPEIESMFASANVSMYATMNPTRAKGPAYDMVTAQRHLYTIHQIKAWDTPNLSSLGPGRDEILDALLAMPDDRGGPLDRNVMPFLISRRYVRDMWEKCDRNEMHPQWLSRIEAEFPSSSDDLLLDLMWIEKAEAAAQAPSVPGRLVAWVDVGGSGQGGRDETALCIGEHWWDEKKVKHVTILHEQQWKGVDARGPIIEILKRTQYQARWLTGSIAIDKGGLGHFWPRDFTEAGLSNVHGIDYGSPAHDVDTFSNRKAEIFWRARGAFERGEVTGLEAGSKTTAQLSTVKWETESKYARIHITNEKSKDPTNPTRKVVKSPDRGESALGVIGWPIGQPSEATTGSWAEGDGLSNVARMRGREW